MARKSLSSQVIEELDRTAGLLRPVQDIVDPMTSHMVGAALDGIQRALDLCYAARTGVTDSIIDVVPNAAPESTLPVAPATTRRPRTAHKAPGRRKEA